MPACHLTGKRRRCGVAAAAPRLLLARRCLSVLFFGSDRFAVPFLERLHRDRGAWFGKTVTHLEAVVPPDGRGGRGRKEVYESAVKVSARALGVPVHEAPPKKTPMTDFAMPRPSNGEDAFDIGVVVSFPHFLTSNVVGAFRKGAINFHPSLLPLYRGGAPIQHTILNGDTETGMTVVDISLHAWDSGHVLLQEPVTISPRIDYNALATLFQHRGPPMVMDVLRRFDELWAKRQPQDDTRATKAGKINSKMGHVSLLRDSALRLDRIQRAFGHQYPVRVNSRGKVLAMFDVCLAPERVRTSAVTALQPGMAMLTMSQKQLIVRCRDDIVLVSSLQWPMRKVVMPADFVQGLQLKQSRPFVLESPENSARADAGSDESGGGAGGGGVSGGGADMHT
eukprot:Unigene8795_Nuclearia_a/m.26913 Unigene8795_Nuclearia_a/g.26913  ORF Unigene8795_Nuclearia_a/g.26913 Unigene8795_Nuclearia_a/m.26913 type:complete len:395 (+) Unigene8795_Nuclearia_a:144-1328(+)